MKTITLKIILLLTVVTMLFMGCANNVKSKSKSKSKDIINVKTKVEKEDLIWQKIPGISISNFHKVTKQKFYQKNGVDFTNTLWVIPLPEITEGTITIPLNKKYVNFYTRICVVVGNPWPYETITVYCDDKEVEKIKKIGPKNAPRSLNINTKDVDTLTIKVKPGRKGYYEKVVFFDTALKVTN